MTASSGPQPTRREARRAREAQQARQGREDREAPQALGGREARQTREAHEAGGTVDGPRDGRQAGPAPQSRDDPAAHLVVDPVACDGIGMCAHLAPGVIGLDSWGFPIAPRGPLPARDVRLARAAVSGCPRHALFLDEHP